MADWRTVWFSGLVYWVVLCVQVAVLGPGLTLTQNRLCVCLGLPCFRPAFGLLWDVLEILEGEIIGLIV